MPRARPNQAGLCNTCDIKRLNEVSGTWPVAFRLEMSKPETRSHGERSTMDTLGVADGKGNVFSHQAASLFWILSARLRRTTEQSSPVLNNVPWIELCRKPYR
jgi:hypothetical protein